GTLLYAPHPQASLGQRQSINVWIHDRSPDWRIKMKIGNLDLMVLSAYKLAQNWNARLRLITVVDGDEKEEKAREFMEQLRDLGRFTGAEVCVGRGSFSDYLAEAPQADLSVFGMLPEPDFDFCRRMVESTRSTCLFVRDSGRESALA
ncbi:MAG: Na-K-Cl cotransporter, partial [Bacteroidetes bacterium QS_8_68_15]